mgnify:CR=1 FL=1
MFLLYIERVVLELKLSDGRPCSVHEDIDIAIQWVSQELVSYDLGKFAIAISHVRAPWNKVEVLLSCKC